MPTSTYDLIASNVLGSSAASVTFSSISGSYRDLVIVITGGVTSRTGQYMTLNSDTTDANYSWVRATGTGAATQSGSSTADRSISEIIENAANNLVIIQIMDYSATNKHKSSLIRSNNASPNGVEMRALRWASTNAITSINLEAVGTTWLSGTSFHLYGIVS